MIRAVLFDFGGVIANAGFFEWIDKHIAPHETIKNKIRPLQDKVDRGDLPVSAYDDFFAAITGETAKKVDEEILQSYFLHEDVIQIIKKLKEHKIQTVIVSNFPDKWFSALEKRFHFDSLFDEIFISSRLHMIKPEKKLFDYVFSRLNVKPEETIFVDDTKDIVNDVSQLGVHALLFTSSEKLQKDLLTFGVHV